jgi:hypothetical protein
MEPFVNFGQGSKTVEVRNAKSPVAAQVRKARPGDEVRLRWGYGPHGRHGIREWRGTLGRTWEGPADEIPDWVKAGACLTQSSWSGRFFDPNGRLLCFEVLGAAWNPVGKQGGGDAE